LSRVTVFVPEPESLEDAGDCVTGLGLAVGVRVGKLVGPGVTGIAPGVNVDIGEAVGEKVVDPAVLAVIFALHALAARAVSSRHTFEMSRLRFIASPFGSWYY
jgi:hypothetical protein